MTRRCRSMRPCGHRKGQSLRKVATSPGRSGGALSAEGVEGTGGMRLRIRTLCCEAYRRSRGAATPAPPAPAARPLSCGVLSAVGRQHESLPGVDQVAAADLLLVCGVDDGVAYPAAVDAAADAPEVVAAPDDRGVDLGNQDRARV